MYYMFFQNKTGGCYATNDKLCSKLFIQADSHQEAVDKAEELGCYWDGVARGMDCACCGDRWNPNKQGVVCTDKATVRVWDDDYIDVVTEWEKRYGRYEVIEAPRLKVYCGCSKYEGIILFKNIEEYAQFIVNESFPTTTPNARIFFKDGTIKEIFKEEW